MGALDAPFRASFSGGTLRSLLETLQQASGVPHWLDRRVDPDQSVPPVVAGPTIATAYQAVAEAAGLTSFPVAGVVVVGRPSWVDRVSTVWWTEIKQRPAAERIPMPVQWEFLTSPSQALKAVSERAGLRSETVDLPHDLWPRFQVEELDGATLLLLIGAQFDRWLQVDQEGRVVSQPLPEGTTITERYPDSARLQKLRPRLRPRIPASRWRATNASIEIEAPPRAHRWLVTQLEDPAEGVGPGGRRPAGAAPSPATAMFQFQLKHAPAGAALATLAQSAGWTLEITPAAQAACQQRVTITNAPETTLEGWVERIANEIGVTARREGDRLQIALP
jgi:hypothetical protein